MISNCPPHIQVWRKIDKLVKSAKKAVTLLAKKTTGSYQQVNLLVLWKFGCDSENIKCKSSFMIEIKNEAINNRAIEMDF